MDWTLKAYLRWHNVADDSSDPSAQWLIPSQTRSVEIQNSLRLQRNSVQACSVTELNQNFETYNYWNNLIEKNGEYKITYYIISSLQ